MAPGQKRQAPAVALEGLVQRHDAVAGTRLKHQSRPEIEQPAGQRRIPVRGRPHGLATGQHGLRDRLLPPVRLAQAKQRIAQVAQQIGLVGKAGVGGHLVQRLPGEADSLLDGGLIAGEDEDLLQGAAEAGQAVGAGRAMALPGAFERESTGHDRRVQVRGVAGPLVPQPQQHTAES